MSTMADRRSVLLLYTGGTIGMRQDPRTGRLRPFDFDRLYEQVPELNRIAVRISFASLEKPMDSSNMNPNVWVTIAKLIEYHYARCDGFVILHGTDTMAYTASALSFMLENLAKPVVLTGSQLPIGMIRTDGKENLITAIEVAASGRVPEVAIYFEYKLYRGNRAYKFSADQFRAFESPNYPILAEAGVRIRYNEAAIARRPKGRLKVHTRLDPNIAILKIFPGITRGVVEAVLANAKAVVLETFGSGNAPTEPWLLRALEHAINRGVIILNITQCPSGTVTQGAYETSAGLAKIGVLGGADMTTEAAVTKLMFLLGQGLSRRQVERLLTTPLRGELTVPGASPYRPPDPRHPEAALTREGKRSSSCR